MKPETLRDMLESQGPLGKELVREGGGLDYFTDLLDATVYRSCPECGGKRRVAVNAHPVEPPDPHVKIIDCPACKDAPTAIVSAALREKACQTICKALRERGGCDIWPEYAEDAPGCDGCGGCEMCGTNVDAVLSTVLGRPVRYAKEVGRVVQLNGPVVVQADGDPDSAGLLRAGTLIAILEEAGKEEDGQ